MVIFVYFYHDSGLVVSITQPCYHLDLLIGAVGLDIHLSHLVEDMTYFNQPGGHSYAFLLDTFGSYQLTFTTIYYIILQSF